MTTKRCNKCEHRQWDPEQRKYKCCYRNSPRGRCINNMYTTPSWCPIDKEEADEIN